MYVIIAGCGRLGSGVARALSAKGNDVVVVDEGAERRLVGDGFDGLIVDGSPVDEDVLALAGMKKADLFIAATSDDNRNIMAVQMAMAVFGVPKAIARVSDPELERFYRAQGLSTVCPTSTGINQIVSKIQQESFSTLGGVMDPNVAALIAPPEWVGLAMARISPPTHRKVIGIVSRGRVHGWEPSRLVGPGDSVLLSKGDDA
ncbi:MAG TPA: TrkA family potassium uptake protein [bacterium]|nr:TrkA family potassium uptake protein [bacterium]